MRLSSNRKILVTGAFILIAIFVISLTPWYEAYCAHDHRWTCSKIRKSFEWNYHDLVADAASDYSYGQMDTLEAVIHKTYSAQEITLVPEDGESGYSRYAIEGLCRSGGTIHIAMNDTGEIRVTCDAPNHDVDYTEIEEYGLYWEEY